METEAEQMARFYGSVEKMWPAMKRQMRDNADKGGWQDMTPEDLIQHAIPHARAMKVMSSYNQQRHHIIAAVNYLVMAYERLSAEETE